MGDSSIPSRFPISIRHEPALNPRPSVSRTIGRDLESVSIPHWQPNKLFSFYLYVNSALAYLFPDGKRKAKGQVKIENREPATTCGATLIELSSIDSKKAKRS